MPISALGARADVDHLAILHAIWAAETGPVRDQRYHTLLMNSLPPAYRRQPGHQAKWLWRTVRAAELAGLDPAQNPGRRDRRTGPGRLSRHRRRPRRPHPEPLRHPGPVAGPAVAGAAPCPRRPRTPRVRGRDRGADGRPQEPDRRAWRRPPTPLGRHRARPGPSPPAGPARLAETGRRHRRLARTPPPHRARPPRP